MNNDVFAESSWYFRNALVRANYNDLKRGIHETNEVPEQFLENLLLGTKHKSKNRYLHVDVTGSNSRMMSSEIKTYLTGSYVSFRVYTLSLAEYLSFQKSVGSGVRPARRADQLCAAGRVPRDAFADVLLGRFLLSPSRIISSPSAAALSTKPFTATWRSWRKRICSTAARGTTFKVKNC